MLVGCTANQLSAPNNAPSAIDTNFICAIFLSVSSVYLQYLNMNIHIVLQTKQIFNHTLLFQMKDLLNTMMVIGLYLHFQLFLRCNIFWLVSLMRVLFRYSNNKIILMYLKINGLLKCNPIDSYPDYSIYVSFESLLYKAQYCDIIQQVH